MTFTFPNLLKLSLWDIACRHTGQNAADHAPTNATRDKLAEFVQAARGKKLWVEFVEVGIDHGFITGTAGDGNRAAVDADWRKLDRVTVRREDWERYKRGVDTGEQTLFARDGTAQPSERPQNIGADGVEVWTEQQTALVSQATYPDGTAFITLAEAIDCLALRIDVPKGRTTADNEPMWRASEAAGILYSRLQNATDKRPTFSGPDLTTEMPSSGNAITEEGMAILLHAAGWYDRDTTVRYRYKMDCVKSGLDSAAAGPAPYDPNDGQWDYSKRWMRERQIGFDRDELSAFIGVNFRQTAIGGQDKARAILGTKFERLDRIAWALVILTPDSPAADDVRYRQILGVTKWLESLDLQFRTANGLPASQPLGVPITGMDVREYKYLAVRDVRAAALADGCWPSEVNNTIPTLSEEQTHFDEHWTIAEAAEIVGTDAAGIYERFLDGRLKTSVFFPTTVPAQLVRTSNPLWLTNQGDVDPGMANELRGVRYVWDLTLYA